MAIEVGNVFEGRVTGVKPFGAFVALPEGRVGMVHISEVSNEFVQDIAAVLHDGDIVKVQVINIAPDGKIALSYGYYRYQTDIMIVCVILLVLMVQVFQSAGTFWATRSDKRLRK